MITRRQFVHTSVAASLGVLVGCEREPEGQTPGVTTADGELRLYFVGGSVLVKEGDNSYLALQLSGKGMTYNGHSLEHLSYIVGPEDLLTTAGIQMPAVSGLSGLPIPAQSRAVCLLKKTVTIDAGGDPKVTNSCRQLASYDHISTNWKRKGNWDPASNDLICSIFNLRHGELVDDAAVNQTAAAVEWWVKDPGKKKHLSDIAVLQLKAPTISISGLTTSPLTINNGRKAAFFVFSGPLHMHPDGYKYSKISHALLLKTIYDVMGTPDNDIMPQTAHDIDGEKGEPITNPCDISVKIRVPPDSEYCPNYEGIP